MGNTQFTPDAIRKYILSELVNNKEFLFNELDLQMFVARILEQEFKVGYKIYLEYHLPNGWNTIFDAGYARWGTEKPCFDIVIENTKKSKFIAIELKYKLMEIQAGTNFERFGTSNTGIPLVTDQSARNEGRYDFWKDVKRLELLKDSFNPNVIGGIALFVTNDVHYTENKESFKYSKFNFEDTKCGFLYWNYKDKRICQNTFNCGEGGCPNTPCGEKKKKKDLQGEDWTDYERPNFELKEYKGEWFPDKEGFTGPMNQQFYCYSVII